MASCISINVINTIMKDIASYVVMFTFGLHTQVSIPENFFLWGNEVLDFVQIPISTCELHKMWTKKSDCRL